jgi:hypothetical protein
VVISLRERGGEPDEGEEAGGGLGAAKPLDLQSSATSEGSSIASLPLPETKEIPGGGSEAAGLPLRKESRPESGDGDGDGDGEDDDDDDDDDDDRAMMATSPLQIVLESGRTRRAGALKFGASARDVELDSERIVIGRRGDRRSAIARRLKCPLFLFLARSKMMLQFHFFFLLFFFRFSLFSPLLHFSSSSGTRTCSSFSERHCARLTKRQRETERKKWTATKQGRQRCRRRRPPLPPSPLPSTSPSHSLFLAPSSRRRPPLCWPPTRPSDVPWGRA